MSAVKMSLSSPPSASVAPASLPQSLPLPPPPLADGRSSGPEGFGSRGCLCRGRLAADRCMSGSVERKVAYRAPSSCCICSAVRSCTLPTEAAASGVERLRLHLQFFDQKKKHIEFGHFQQRSSKGPKLKATLHLLCSAPLLMCLL